MKYLLADRGRGKFDKIILIGHHRQYVSANWFGCLTDQTMGKECCFWLSRRLWGASAIRSPLKTTAWEASLGPARTNNDLPPSKCEMAKVNCCRTAVALVTLARPAGKQKQPNLACAWPEDRSGCCSCPFHPIF